MAEPDLRRSGAKRDLASLRIDRDAIPAKAPRMSLWAGIGVAGAITLGLLLWLWLGGETRVTIAYAERSAPGATPSAEVLTGSGYIVTADRYVSLGVRVPSRIVAYLVEEGETVEAQQPLVQLDARQYEAALAESRAARERARADVELFRRELDRTRELHARDVASDADLDLKRNQLRVAQAEVERLAAQIRRQEVDLEDTVIRAPTRGVILEKFKEVGEIAVPGGFQGSGELIRMANLDRLRAELDVNEADLGRIRLGQPARVVPEAFPDRAYAARVVKLYPQINRQKGTLKVEVELIEPDATLRPDMSVRIAFLESAAPQDQDAPDPGVVLVPSQAVRTQPGGPFPDGPFVWVVTEGSVRRQTLEVGGPAPDGRLIVTGGLLGGEALVLDGDVELREGQHVEATP